MEFCKRCFYSTAHPLGLVLDSEGICSGCRVHEEKDTLDWRERWALLESIVDPYRSKDGSNYDCIVPVNGGRDSHYIVHLVKNKLKLNPLLVSYNSYYNTPIGIRNLANLRIQFNCDFVSQNVNPLSVKRIVRYTLSRFGSLYWPVLAGQTAFPVQTAIRFRVPLIIWGAHQGIEQVGMFSHLQEVEMTRRYRKEHDLMGYEADDLISIFDTLSEDDIWQYRYPSDSDIERVGVRGIYLGNYVRWDPKPQHESMIKNFGYSACSMERTFDTYEHVECFNYMDLHDYLKLLKHGFSRVTDHATREIRHGRLSREHGLTLILRHENLPLQYSQLFCEWLGIERRSLDFILDAHRNPLYWQKDEHGYWLFKGWSSMHRGVDSCWAKAESGIAFKVTSAMHSGDDCSYITIGKGWPIVR